MTLTFSNVLEDLVSTVVAHAEFATFAELVVVRDLKGIVRLAAFVHPPGPVPAQGPTIARVESALGAVEQAIKAQLGPWFQGPVLSDVHRDPLLTKVANRLRKDASPWNPQAPLGTPVPGSWRLLERRLTKDAWASVAPAAPPWPLKGDQPAIVAFYSFKGGVGRSTALAAVAFQLASKEKRVAIVDLDLEAPGMGPFFGVSPLRGVIDVLVDYRVTDQLDLNQASARPSVPFGGAENLITVFPAGARLDAAYLEMLGRLDFGRAAFGDDSSPVAVALGALLKKLRSDFDYLLIDARAGLHDLGGLALQGLAHIDVIVARPSEQTTAGLSLALRHLRSVRGDGMQVVVVHGQAPSDHTSRESEDFRNTVYDLFSEAVYPAEADRPALDADSHMHHVIPIPQDPRLFYLRNATDAVEVFQSGTFEPLAKRLSERIDLVRAP